MSDPAMQTVAEVFLLDTVESIDRLYSYLLPASLSGKVGRGSLVCLPFGSSDRKKSGVVVSLSPLSEEPKKKLKTLSLYTDCPLVLSEEQLSLIEFLRARTFCTRGEAFRAVIPAGAYAAVKYIYTANPVEPPSPPTGKSGEIYVRLREKGDASFARLFAEYGEGTGSALSSLKDRGLISLYEKTEKASRGKTEERFSLAVSQEEATKKLSSVRGEVRKRLLLLLIEREEISKEELKAEGITSAQTAFFEKEGLILRKTSVVYRDRLTLLGKEGEDAVLAEKEKNKLPLNDDQKTALSALSALSDEKKPRCALLFGVTGSGKTRVVTSLIDKVLSEGKSAIYLVPEIALTPQTLAVFSAKYGEKIALIHSSLSDGERYDAWRRMRDGIAKVALGTRSAVFAPLSDLGLIVIDEEQEHTYKSDAAPRYHAREVASFRAGFHSCLLVLASATPSLETMYRAQTGRYALVSLPNRFNGAPLPKTRFADMREDLAKGKARVIGSELQKALSATLSAGEQAILFLNRRGYRSSVVCPHCGKTLVCPHCSVTMTFHAAGRIDPENGKANGYLSCHYCGHRDLLPSVCPSCGKEGFAFLGFGTQKAEEELHTLFPEANILRLDADSVRGKNAYEEKLSAFRQHEYDILLGTQMVVKGHDFPSVTLVGVLAAENSLFLSDYRANEITFDLLTQVTGRAGRAGKSGLSVIQTFCPEHPLFSFAEKQDYLSFYRDEIDLRKSYLFPPFCDLVVIEVSAGNEETLLSGAVLLSTRAIRLIQSDFPDLQMQIFGPFESPLYKIKETYRMRLILKCRFDRKARDFLEKLKAMGPLSDKARISLSIVVNPGNV